MTSKVRELELKKRSLIAEKQKLRDSVQFAHLLAEDRHERATVALRLLPRLEERLAKQAQSDPLDDTDDFYDGNVSIVLRDQVQRLRDSVTQDPTPAELAHHAEAWRAGDQRCIAIDYAVRDLDVELEKVRREQPVASRR
jgi:hypothetical protein